MCLLLTAVDWRLNDWACTAQILSYKVRQAQRRGKQNL
jgi:hypothetical protein